MIADISLPGFLKHFYERNGARECMITRGNNLNAVVMESIEWLCSNSMFGQHDPAS